MVFVFLDYTLFYKKVYLNKKHMQFTAQVVMHVRYYNIYHNIHITYCGPYYNHTSNQSINIHITKAASHTHTHTQADMQAGGQAGKGEDSHQHTHHSAAITTLIPTTPNGPQCPLMAGRIHHHRLHSACRQHFN